MKNVGRLGQPDNIYNVKPGIPKKEIKAELPDLQDFVDNLKDIQPVFRSLAQKANQNFPKRKFKNLTNKPPFNEKVPGPANYVPPNRAS
jgi:hypothetical protein